MKTKDSNLPQNEAMQHEPVLCTGLLCPECGEEMKQIDSTYSNIKTNRCEIGQHMEHKMNNDTELVEFYKFLSERAIIDDCCRGEGEAECAVKLYNKSKVKNLDIQRVSGSLQPLTIDNVSKMLKKASKETWIAAKGNENGFKEWYAKRCKLNLNSSDR
jgi:hypothetical protein